MSTVPDMQITHVGIHVTNVAQMVDFYSSVLGFTVTDRGVVEGSREFAFMSRNPQEHHQIVIASGRPENLAFNVVNQISLLVRSLADLRAVHSRVVQDERVSGLEAITHGNSWSIYFRDPEGNRLEIYAHTPWYISQPFRVPFDINRSDAEILLDTEALCRSQPSFQSRGEWTQSMARKMGRG